MGLVAFLVSKVSAGFSSSGRGTALGAVGAAGTVGAGAAGAGFGAASGLSPSPPWPSSSSDV